VRKTSFEVRGLAKRYRGVRALDEVSFTIRDGEVLGLVGPNGAGKTTLLECLAGIQPADAGDVVHDGRPLGAADRTHALFYLPDSIAPWPAQTVGWAIDFTVGLFGGRASERAAVIAELELQPLLHKTLGTLSKGQRRRATLAIALLTPQPLLVADEPFEGLDLRQSREIARVLRRHASAGRTMLLSIHQIADAARVCDRLVLLSAGRVRGEGTIDELADLAGLGGQTSAPRDLEEVVLALT
jgi:ABC-2 type transport system ATP-binding protein